MSLQTFTSRAGSPDVTNSFIKIMQPYGIVEVARTGVIALQKDE
mgnify:CR=1 FL=1